MEKLKGVIPERVKRMMEESEMNPSTCSSFLKFMLELPHFHQILCDIHDPQSTPLCAKNIDTALQLKLNANHCFSNAQYPNALPLYSQALRVAPINADVMDKNLVATLYLNRASCLHKLGLMVESLRDCNRALVISPNYAKAWYRRGKVNASLENYDDAIRDFNIAMNLERSLGGSRLIKSELKLILDQNKRLTGSSDKHIVNKPSLGEHISDENHEKDHIELQCIYTSTKGRGMAARDDVHQASLIHTEEPYAAVILKPCRETHCHFCFNELPVDTVPCLSCSIPLYCSQHCQVQAGGHGLKHNSKNCRILENISVDLQKYIEDIVLAVDSDLKIEGITEHKHECQGIHWPSILPSEIVLAGRVLVKSIEQKRRSEDISYPSKISELSHSFAQMSPEGKLELHIYSIILLYCLQDAYGTEFPLNGASISQVVILISQIKVNSMAVVRMKSSDGYGLLDLSTKPSRSGGALTSNVEQVRVGQAIYASGSLFNHSCQPNIHAYFLSRTLFIRSTEFVAAGSPLELSYGPQVGQWDCKKRQEILEESYSFHCQCKGCSEINISDLVLNAFRCICPSCFGVVLDSFVAECETRKLITFQAVPKICRSYPHLQIEKHESDNTKKVDRGEPEQINCSLQIEPGYCLNCGSFRDLESLHAEVGDAELHITRLQDAIFSNDVAPSMLSDAFRALDLLKSTLHAYNKRIAEAEDNLAQAFCLAGELKPALHHCKASIVILEKLYGPNHIVIGNELMKLSSIQLSLDDSGAVESVDRVVTIYSEYYGPHADTIFPYLQCLKREALKLTH